MYCFFFNDTATTEIYTLSLHDALPISIRPRFDSPPPAWVSDHILPALTLLDRGPAARDLDPASDEAVYGANISDRKSTRLNSSHANISYAVFCLKKKNTPTA